MNPRPLPCEGSALPLRYSPGRPTAIIVMTTRRLVKFFLILLHTLGRSYSPGAVITMSFGPELFLPLAMNLSVHWMPARMSRVETGASWAALRIGGKDAWLLYSWDPQKYGCGIVTDGDVALLKRMRGSRSSFGEALKSNLQGAILLSAERMGKDRILVVRAERIVGAGFPLSYALLFEGMERNSNLLILDGQDRILECAKHVYGDMNRFRSVLPGMTYTPPPPLQGRELSCDDVIASPADLRGLIGIGRGLASLVEKEWASRSPSSWETAIRTVLGGGALEELRLQRAGAYLTVFPDLLPGAVPLDGDVGRACGRALMADMATAQSGKVLAGAKKAIGKEIAGRERLLEGLRNQIQLAEMGGQYLKMGNLLLASLHAVPQRSREVTLTDWGTGEKIVIPLDDRRTPQQNADRYFKKYRKGKVDVEAVESRIRSVEEGIAELREQLEDLDRMADDPEVLAASAQDLMEWVSPKKKEKGSGGKKKREDVPPYLLLHHGGCAIYVGVNARGNRHVTFRIASQGDLWFHVHDMPGAHVVVKEIDGAADEETIHVAASLAAWFSRAREASKVQVDYTERKNVRSIPGSAIAHVTYRNPRTVIVPPGLWREYPEVARSKVLEGRT